MLYSENIELEKVELSTEFQQLDLQQQKRLQVFMDALRDLRDVFEKAFLQQLDEIKDLNRTEHTATRAIITTTHEKTINTIKTEQKAGLLLTSKEAAGTRHHVSLEQGETREHISATNREVQGLITSAHAQTARDAEQQHAVTRSVVVDTVVQENASTKQSLKDDNQQKLEFLEAELFRAQLENKSNILKEHAWTRQALEERDSRINAEAAANMLQSRALLQQSAALCREEQQTTAARVKEHPVPTIAGLKALQSSGDATDGDHPSQDWTMTCLSDPEWAGNPSRRPIFERAYERALTGLTSSRTRDGESVRFVDVESKRGLASRFCVEDHLSNYRLRERDLLHFLQKKFGPYSFKIRVSAAMAHIGCHYSCVLLLTTYQSSHDRYTFIVPRQLTKVRNESHFYLK